PGAVPRASPTRSRGPASRWAPHGPRDEGRLLHRTTELLSTVRAHRRSRARARLGDGVLARLESPTDGAKGVRVPGFAADLSLWATARAHVSGRSRAPRLACRDAAGRRHLPAASCGGREAGAPRVVRPAVH